MIMMAVVYLLRWFRRCFHSFLIWGTKSENFENSSPSWWEGMPSHELREGLFWRIYVISFAALAISDNWVHREAVLLGFNHLRTAEAKIGIMLWGLSQPRLASVST